MRVSKDTKRKSPFVEGPLEETAHLNGRVEVEPAWTWNKRIDGWNAEVVLPPKLLYV